jgi:hypothetical protein
MCFAHLKRILKLDRLRLRGPCGAHDEFLLAATAHVRLARKPLQQESSPRIAVGRKPLKEESSCEAGHVTAPDQCCRNVRKFLPGRRPHVTISDVEHRSYARVHRSTHVR